VFTVSIIRAMVFEVVGTTETLLHCYQTKRHNIPEDILCFITARTCNIIVFKVICNIQQLKLGTKVPTDFVILRHSSYLSHYIYWSIWGKYTQYFFQEILTLNVKLMYSKGKVIYSWYWNKEHAMRSCVGVKYCYRLLSIALLKCAPMTLYMVVWVSASCMVDNYDKHTKCCLSLYLRRK
jgi:hypothetical protein